MRKHKGTHVISFPAFAGSLHALRCEAGDLTRLQVTLAEYYFATTGKLHVMKYILALIVSLSCMPLAVGAPPGEVPIGEFLRDMPMQGLTGDSLLLSEYRGKPLLINVWASYCPPCLAEMGSLEQLKQRFSKQFNVIGVSIDDYPERAMAFLDKANTTFPHYMDHQLKLERMFGASTIPVTLLIDANGRVLQKVRGAREWDSPEIVAAIARTFKLSL
jgi:thiol-disulfide isomerase/thioredoxin